MLDLRQFAIGLAVIVLIDAVYLSLAIPRLYKPGMSAIARPKMEGRHLAAGFLSWVVIVIALQILVLPRARTPDEAFALGAVFGGSSYLIYNLVNYATLPWPGHMAAIDSVWGAVLSGIVARIMFTNS